MAKNHYRLRFLDHIHHLPRGEVVLGRSEACHVQLEGDLVSREHARIKVSDRGVTLHDLGSKNGCFVNGSRVKDPLQLEHGDRIRIAFFDLTFEVIPRMHSSPATLQLLYCVGCSAALTSDMNFCVHCGAQVPGEARKGGCPGCGAGVTPHMRFCTMCGSELCLVEGAL